MNVGDRIAWNMRDGRVMTAEVIFVGFNEYTGRRPDSGIVTVTKNLSRRATLDDWQDSINFFTK